MYFTNIYTTFVSVNFFNTQQQYKCKCKKFRYVIVNDLHLHEIYTPYTRLFTLTHNIGMQLQNSSSLKKIYIVHAQ